MFSRDLGDDAALVLLRPYHAEELFAVVDRNREHLRRWLPWVDAVRGVEDERAFIQRSLNELASSGAVACGIVHGGTLVGGIGMLPINWLNKKVEIGYWLDEAHQGKGLMTRAARALVAHAFDDLKLNRVMIYCATDNRRSQAVAERLGFAREGVHRQASYLRDRFVDLVSYGMIASDRPRESQPF